MKNHDDMRAALYRVQVKKREAEPDFKGTGTFKGERVLIIGNIAQNKNGPFIQLSFKILKGKKNEDFQRDQGNDL